MLLFPFIIVISQDNPKYTPNMQNGTQSDQVWIHDDKRKIVFYKEPVSTTKEQLDYNFHKIAELAKPYENFFLILDLTIASRPGPEIRQHIMENFALINPKLVHASIFTGKNFILNMAATFVLKKSGLGSYSIHKTQEEAEKALEKFIK